MGRTLYDKIWDEHVVHTEEDGTAILYIDRHLVHEVTSPQAFEGLREAGRKVWRISSIVATADHNTPTTGWELGYDGITDLVSKEQITTLDSSSDGYWSNSTARLSPELACWRPFSKVVVKSGARPRIEITWTRPLTRWAARRGRRAIDSPIDTSGSLPMSSAEIASTIEVSFFLMLIEFWMPALMPVTTTASTVSASGLAGAS